MRCIFRRWFTLTVSVLLCVYRVSDLFVLTLTWQTAWHITQDELLADWCWSVIYRRNIDQLILASTSCQSKSSCSISSLVAVIKTGNPNWVTKVMILWWQPVPCMETRRAGGWGSQSAWGIFWKFPYGVSCCGCKLRKNVQCCCISLLGGIIICVDTQRIDQKAKSTVQTLQCNPRRYEKWISD